MASYFSLLVTIISTVDVVKYHNLKLLLGKMSPVMVKEVKLPISFQHSTSVIMKTDPAKYLRTFISFPVMRTIPVLLSNSQSVLLRYPYQQ